MPLTGHQRRILAVLAPARASEGYLAGGAALHFSPNSARSFVEHRPAEEVGCLYYAPARERFEEPSSSGDLASQGLVTHFGRPGGVLPRPTDMGLLENG